MFDIGEVDWTERIHVWFLVAVGVCISAYRWNLITRERAFPFHFP